MIRNHMQASFPPLRPYASLGFRFIEFPSCFEAGALRLISKGFDWLSISDQLAFKNTGITLKFGFFEKEPCQLFVL